MISFQEYAVTCLSPISTGNNAHIGMSNSS